MNQKTVDELRAAQTRVIARVGETEAKIPDLEAAVVTANDAMNDAIGAELRGDIGANEVEAAKRNLREAQDSLDFGLRTIRQGNFEAQKLEKEIYLATQAAFRARLERCDRICEEIKARIRADKKLRASLVEIYALARVAAGFGGDANWEGIIFDLFPKPEVDEFAAFIDAATERLEA